MFCRFLGQSLGAAIFGAIVNSTLKHWLAAAPSHLSGSVPTTVDGIEPAVEGHRLPGGALDYLRQALDAATHHVYLGLLAVAVLAALVLFVAPRHFPVLEPSAPPVPAVGGDEPGAG
jgi:hypothetical protein